MPECVLSNLTQGLDAALNSLAGYAGPAGSYSVLGISETCTSCGAGTAAGAVGSTSSSACATCDAGTYAGSGTQLGCSLPLLKIAMQQVQRMSQGCPVAEAGRFPLLPGCRLFDVPALQSWDIPGIHRAVFLRPLVRGAARAQFHHMHSLGESAACGQQHPAHSPLCCCSVPPQADIWLCCLSCSPASSYARLPGADQCVKCVAGVASKCIAGSCSSAASTPGNLGQGPACHALICGESRCALACA